MGGWVGGWEGRTVVEEIGLVPAEGLDELTGQVGDPKGVLEAVVWVGGWVGGWVRGRMNG